MKKILSFFIALALVVSFSTVANADGHYPFGEITSPDLDEVTHGTINLTATYEDGDDLDDDIVQWAVREGTCAAGTNTVWGNVDGHNDPYTWTLDGMVMNFESSLDVTTLDPGQYCFIFNPRDDAGETNVRETQMFYVVHDVVHGGGHALEKNGKRKNWLDFSFGGVVGDAGSSGLVGDWTVVLHNVNNGDDKGKFHGSDVTALNLFAGNSGTCDEAVNFTVMGSYNGEDGARMIFRGGDQGSPNHNLDTVRVELWDASNSKVYDSHWQGEFPDESSCVGSARTGLDKGNLQIEM